MTRTIIFSHESDIDGLGCVVLSKLAFGDIDCIFAPNIEKLESMFREFIESHKMDEYDDIYVTDLALYDPSLTMVAKSSLKDKVHVFDHHQRAIDDGINRYPFTKIVENDGNEKKCGTKLFYEYLIQNDLIINSTAISEFVELTRLEDTWEWKNSGPVGNQAHDLAILFNAIGLDNYISSMPSKLLSNPTSFEFSEEEKVLIKNKKEEYNKFLQSIILSAEYFWDENANKTYEDEETRFVFNPKICLEKSFEEVQYALTKYKVALQKQKQTEIWLSLCNTFVELYDGDIRNLFASLDNDVDKIRNFIQKENKKKFPYLSGTKICNYWLYVIYQYTNRKYKNIENLTVAPDTHVVKATHRLGLITDEELNKSDVQLIVIDRWNELLTGTKYKPIDIHTPLWLWSRNGFKEIK